MRSRLACRVRTTLSLGVLNVIRVASYRLRLRAGVHPVQRLHPPTTVDGPFFSPVHASSSAHDLSVAGEVGRAFGWRAPDQPGIPDWHKNVFTGRAASAPTAPWWTLADFDPAIGDIKTVWEASRFDWVVQFAQRAARGDAASARQLEEWLQDWCHHNPPYRGLNWKCGQEASIRVMHLAVAALVLDQVDTPTDGMRLLVRVHLERIAPTVSYAMGQDNNHGTSEAAALLVGGSWLARHGDDRGREWERAGRALLEDRVARLLARDGSFSQHSVTYHRLVLDTLSIAEVWRRHMALAPFSATFTERAAAATGWLHALVDHRTGDAPNLGANDGANLLPLTDADYRDFRPSVELAAALFLGANAYPEAGAWHDHLRWLGVNDARGAMAAPASRLMDDGGYAVLRKGAALAVLRYPRFRFRPSHADALHVDLWVNGENLLRDSGTYSYNAERDVQDYFTGARAHNGIQFDGREQMPRLSRFLWGDWLSPERVDSVIDQGADVTAGASYRDAVGARHDRRVSLAPGHLTVTDQVDGFTTRAVLRWRLRPGAWRLTPDGATDGEHMLTISASVPIVRQELVSGSESRYYMRREPIPVLEVEVERPGQLVSAYRWSA